LAHSGELTGWIWPLSTAPLSAVFPEVIATIAPDAFDSCPRRILSRYFFSSMALSLLVWETSKNPEGMMKSNFFRIASLATLILVLSLANTAFAAHHDDDNKFTGVVENLPGAAGFVGDWRVSGKTVHVTGLTIIEQPDGQAAVGATVKVEGSTRADGSVDAKSIEVKQGASSGSGGDGGEDQGGMFEGTIENVPNTPGFIGDWRVGGRTIHVSASTRIETEFGPVAVGAFVEVYGSARTDASIDATKIETKSNAAGGDGRDELKGLIEALPAGFVGDWRISGRTVHVTAATMIDQEHGAPAVGASVEVSGMLRADGSFDAARIEVKGASSGPDEGSSTFKGTIESFPSTPGFIGDWQVGGRTIHVSSSTRIETVFGPIAVGAFVEVQGARRADGSIDATKIETKSNVAGGDGRDELKGAIEALPSAGFIGDWRINGRTVHVTSATIINQEHGAAAVGAFVEVTGTRRADGSIDATRIEIQPLSGSSGSGPGGSSNEGEPANVKGAIQSLPASGVVGDWTVGGRLVHVVSSTKLNAEHGAFVVGARVKVKGMLMADGSVVATKVQLRDSN
jgi:cytoskeletal protein CcmA (bactofilin family)